MERKQSIFRDPARQKEFEENGFLKISLLSPSEADDLYSFYKDRLQQHESDSSLHHTTTDTRNTELIREVDSKIKNTLTARLDEHLTRYKPLASCFHIKEPGAGSATGIHQDPTFVDETQYYSANVWVALQDVNTENGNLFFIKGSNRYHSLRPVPYYPPYYEPFAAEMPGLRVEVPLKKGEAVIFQNATVHGATDNLSAGKRLAATLLISSDEAQWCLYYNADRASKNLEQYDMDFDSFIALNTQGKPRESSYRAEVSYEFPQMSGEEFREYFSMPADDSPSQRPSWFSSLFKSKSYGG